jgi:hypothetical protein
MLMVVVPLTVLAMAPAPAANAAPVARNGVCEEEELCMYSDDAYQGYVIDFAACSDRRRHSAVSFPGTNIRIENQVKSVWNRSGYVYEIYDRTKFRGSSKTIFGGRVDNLGPVENDNRSHKCVGS